MIDAGRDAPLTPRNADFPQPGMDAGPALKTATGTGADEAGTVGNPENSPPPAWQDISTAPRDGTPILVSDGRTVAAAYWGRASRSYPWDRDYPWVMLDETNGLNGWKDGPSGPTHWMPLPLPPSPPQEDGT